MTSSLLFIVFVCAGLTIHFLGTNTFSVSRLGRFFLGSGMRVLCCRNFLVSGSLDLCSAFALRFSLKCMTFGLRFRCASIFCRCPWTALTLECCPCWCNIFYDRFIGFWSSVTIIMKLPERIQLKICVLRQVRGRNPSLLDQPWCTRW
jgi:hypothetical protein